MIQSHKIIIFLDEIDRLLPAMIKPKDESSSSEHGLSESGFKGFEWFLAVLRGLAQETKRLVLVVTSVNADINRIPRWEIGTGRENPMWQGFVEYFISLLSPDETDDMVTSFGAMMGLKYAPEALSHLYHLTHGHPFLTRQICAHFGFLFNIC